MSLAWRAIAGVALAVGCSGKAADPGRAADELASGLAAAVALTEADPPPILCARLPSVAPNSADDEIALEDGSLLRRQGYRLTITVAKDRQPTIAIVSDAREASTLVEETIAALISTWERDDVAVVFALGGMGESAEELTKMLAPLTSKRRALIAAPGDREGVAALEAAVATLRGRGLPVFATSSVRVVSIAGATIGLLPGVAGEAGLVSGGDGCLHREEDAAALAELLAAADAPRIWLSYAAPRQQGDLRTASDLSEGVHAGDRALSAAIDRAAPQLVFHGQIEPPRDAPLSGVASRRASAPQMIAVGALEELSALIGEGKTVGAGVVVALEPSRLAWRRTSR